MAVLFLLLFLCGIPQANADNIQSMYVAAGETIELPCPSPPTLDGDELLSWFHSPAASSPTVLVAQVQMTRPVEDPGKPGREFRPRLLGNYSLWLDASRDGDAGRYWCAVLGQRYKYQNWRIYDISVLKGSQFSATSADGILCSVLLCSVVPARRLDSVTWLEGRSPVRGHVQPFWSNEAALLLVCPEDELSESRGRRPRIIRCLLPQNTGVSFSLAASMDASPVICAPSGWDVPWIMVLLLLAGLVLIILTLSFMLWRRRAHGTQCRRNRMRCYDCSGGSSSSCKETVIMCSEGERCGFLNRKPQHGLEQTKLTANPSVASIHHHPACVASHHCNQVETELVGEVTYTTQRDCCIGDLCNSAMSSTVTPACILAATATALACLLPGLWLG
ncbi:lymphocyte antigen 6 complex locus protein G6f [Suncus etruscus]|uniref:lymphocyte antigen 6 complex locus protein G6f n=1 Tax=Suncus etruscus TaxID=109475 RepID=UPI0021108720|nr:lymphocyte antigen 6 complex locus protein G6f [Suncus etruscus]